MATRWRKKPASAVISPLKLTEEEDRFIEIRLSGTESRLLGVECASDDGEVPALELVEELQEVPCFAGLGPKNLVKVIPALEGRRYPKGTTIVKQGDAGDSFDILRSGNAQVVLEREGRPATPIASLGPNEGFGEMALLTDQPRSANVIATTDVSVWCLPRTAFDQLVAENLSLAIYFNRILSQRLRTLQERLIH